MQGGWWHDMLHWPTPPRLNLISSRDLPITAHEDLVILEPVAQSMTLWSMVGKGGLHHHTFKVQSGCVCATLIKGLQLTRIQSPVWIEGYRFWIVQAWWKRNDCVKCISGSFFVHGDGATPWVMRNKRHSWEVQNCFHLVNSDQSYRIMGQ